MFDRRSIAPMTLLAVALLTACRPDPLAPPLAGESAAALSAQNGRTARGRWRFNSDKYRDRGARPATGRSGSAAIDVDVLAGAGGLVTLQVTSFRAGHPSRPAGDIERVQVKAMGPDGSLLFVRNYNRLDGGSVFTAVFTGLSAGVTFRVTAHVGGLDGRRTDVVTVGGAGVHRAPDLAITGIGLPSAVFAGTPTVVTATIAELGGERGARADCELRVDGRVADRARGIWVDAGDAVACAFTVTFDAAGRHELAVALERVRPHDGTRRNNRRTAIVDVQAPSTGAGVPSVDWTASVRWGVRAAHDTFDVTLTAPDGSLFFRGANASRADGTVQEALMSAQIGTALAFPLTRIEVAQASGGALLHQAAWADVPADGGGSVGVECVARGAGTGVEFYLCANALGFSSLTYRRTAGSVTYQSSGYQQTWNGVTYDVDTYVDNSIEGSPGPLTPFGSSYVFDVRVTAGGTTYGVGASVPLGPVNESEGAPLTCTAFTLPIDGVPYGAQTCFASSASFTGIAGTAGGAGFVGAAPAGLRLVP